MFMLNKVASTNWTIFMQRKKKIELKEEEQNLHKHHWKIFFFYHFFKLQSMKFKNLSLSSEKERNFEIYKTLNLFFLSKFLQLFFISILTIQNYLMNIKKGKFVQKENELMRWNETVLSRETSGCACCNCCRWWSMIAWSMIFG